MSEMVYVLAASYDDADAAISAYQAIEAAYKHVGTSHEIDVTVVAKDADGKVEIVKRHDSPTRDRTVMGLGWGLAVGAVTVSSPGGHPRRPRRGRRGRRDPRSAWGTPRGRSARRPQDARRGPRPG